VPLLAIPNVSEGRDKARITSLAGAITDRGARLLDIHSDAQHNRSVLTVTADPPALVAAMVALAAACTKSDLSRHEGAHPRLGVLDVCPIVPFRAALRDAVGVARSVALGIGASGIPVFLYGDATQRAETVELPALRRGGLEGLAERVRTGLRPDEGPAEIDPRVGVVCVGARGPLIAFNLNVDADLEDAKEIVRWVRRAGSLRALALPATAGAQVSMNLIAPEELGIEDAFALVSVAAEMRGIDVISTEIVGLVEERFLPDPDAQVARLLIEPGHSVESALRD
jgi:glutamate formiminotransferase